MATATQGRSTLLKAKLFRGFADPSRLSILEALRSGPRTVTEIVEATSLTQSNASNHLGCLRGCGLVESDQQGRWVRYRLADERIGQILGLADEALADAARGFYECTRYRPEPSANEAGEIAQNEGCADE